MATAVLSRFEVTELKSNIGCTLRADKEVLLSGVKAKEIRSLMESRGVVVFPEINLTDEEQISFTHTLGKFAHDDSEYGNRGGKKGDRVFQISMDPKVNPRAEYIKGAFFWHIDGTMSDTPIFASIMSARALAKEGGDTEFCNTYAAYEHLSAEDKQLIADKRVVHAFWRSQLYVHPEPTYDQMVDWQTLGTKTLPLVWNHRSGRKSLVLGCTSHYVEGMDMSVSEALIVRLRTWATQPQFSYRHTWKLGDMVIWDNTGTMHRALAYDHHSGRLMHRTKLEGEEAFS